MRNSKFEYNIDGVEYFLDDFEPHLRSALFAIDCLREVIKKNTLSSWNLDSGFGISASELWASSSSIYIGRLQESLEMIEILKEELYDDDNDAPSMWELSFGNL